MRDILEAVADGSLSPAEAEVRLSGYATTDAGRFDAARETRRGVPEAILAEGKTPDETAKRMTDFLRVLNFKQVPHRRSGAMRCSRAARPPPRSGDG